MKKRQCITLNISFDYCLVKEDIFLFKTQPHFLHFILNYGRNLRHKIYDMCTVTNLSRLFPQYIKP